MLYLLAAAEFVAAAQVLVYAGAVMVMFLFVIAYLGGRADAPWAGGPRWLQLAAVVAAGALLAETMVALGLKAGGELSDEAEITRAFGAGGDREALPDGSAPRLRDHLGRPAGRGRRRRRPRHALRARAGPRRSVLGPDVPWYLVVSAGLFAIGALGVMLRRSPLIVLLSLEIMLNGANLAFVSFARLHGDLNGQIVAISVMAVAAAEVCVGLGLIVAIARRRLALDVDAMTELRG